MPANPSHPEAAATVRARRGSDGRVVDFTSQRVLGCDGMNSRLRLGLEAWAAQVDASARAAEKAREKEAKRAEKGKDAKMKRKRRFALRQVDSPSAGGCVCGWVGGWVGWSSCTLTHTHTHTHHTHITHTHTHHTQACGTRS